MGRLLLEDRSGAVFVEKLIALLPLLLVFFFGWELAEVTAAQLVVQRASAAAGRAAMVVLADDPMYYGDEPQGSYGGARRADIELAAGMVLSAIPQIMEDFEVQVTDPPAGFGMIDVTVRAPYDCGALGILCSGGTLALSATTRHAYHGAQYDYSVPAGGDVAATPQALMASGAGPVAGTALALSAAKGGAAKGCSYVDCNKDGSFANYPYVIPRKDRTHATQIKFGQSDDLAAAALLDDDGRCKDQKANKIDTTQRNYAALGYSCKDASGNVQKYTIVTSSDKEAGHSEDKLLGRFDAEKAGKGTCTIDGIFTEREPCPACSSLISQRSDVASGFRVTYLYEWNVGHQDNKVESIKPPHCPGLINPATKDLCAAIKKATEKPGAKIPPNILDCIDAAMQLEAANKLKRLRNRTDRQLEKLGLQCARIG
jgi:hypothetical protein